MSVVTEIGCKMAQCFRVECLYFLTDRNQIYTFRTASVLIVMSIFSGNHPPPGGRGKSERARDISNLISGKKRTIIFNMALHLQ